MSDDFHKFLFLGVMIFLAVFSSRNTLYRQATGSVFLKNQAVARLSQNPPVFVLEPPDAEVEKEPMSQTPATVELSEAVVKPFHAYKNDPLPEIGVTSALIGDLPSGEIIWGINQEKRWPIASITKLMTASVISRNMPLNQSVTIIDSDLQADAGFVKSGSKFTVADLMRTTLLVSSNESAEAEARVYGRGNFLAKMNENARSWGLANTFFDDPTGLSTSNQSTAVDLLKLAENIYRRYPEVLEITRKPSVTVSEINSGEKILLKNINNFAGRPDFLGGKTGFTDEARGNLLSVFSYKGRPIVVIVLGTEDRFGDSEKLLNWFEQNFR